MTTSSRNSEQNGTLNLLFLQYKAKCHFKGHGLTGNIHDSPAFCLGSFKFNSLVCTCAQLKLTAKRDSLCNFVLQYTNTVGELILNFATTSYTALT